ncbi:MULTISPECIES: MFS transporter [unclassified Bacillus (in: firmicutes)]|uniref:MFS transporter n=1 Tax=unclassified Bacillus (in: firmicutes) TaxID=185979 RepID=UPI0008DF4336|nr:MULTISPECIES: MFS transporter [unclassified Bacillus (in: firmicutes)]SFB09259.1 Major Facilitator Superfamily protein [Bacillus sp. UNCCL13]SFQ86789.1 Major Facilitator Superfamily protein [Bacillus sp. cl95]
MEALKFERSETNSYKEMKNLYLYATGKSISLFGTAIYSFAIGLFVLKMTGSALSFAVTLILGILPMVILNPFAGVIADKFDKKKMVVWMDLLNGTLLISVYLISLMTGLNLTLIYTATLLLTVFTTFFGVGLEAAKPNLVSDHKLMNLNSTSKIIDSLSMITGPMLGGVVFAFFDIRAFIIFNGVSFIVSGLMMLFMDFKLYCTSEMGKTEPTKLNFIRDIKEGFHYLLGRNSIMSLFVILISLNFFLGFSVTVPLPYMINNVLGLSSKEFGIIQAAFPLGMIIGALLVKKIMNRMPYQSLLKMLCYSLSLFMVLSGMPVLLKGLEWGGHSYVIYYGVVMFSLGVIIAWIDIPLAYFMQTAISDEYRGRVLSIGISIAKTMLPLAMLASGSLLSSVPSFIMPIVGGILFLLFNMLTLAKMKFDISTGEV